MNSPALLLPVCARFLASAVALAGPLLLLATPTPTSAQGTPTDQAPEEVRRSLDRDSGRQAAEREASAASDAEAGSCGGGGCSQDEFGRITRPSYRPNWQQVDQGVGDVSPLGTSLRVGPGELRVPSDFRGVYRDPARGGRLYRMDGGLVASFPLSQYRRNEEGGRQTVIPAGTVYSIGLPTEEFASSPTALRGVPAVPREFGGAVRIEHPVDRPRPLSRPAAQPIDTRQSGRVDVRGGESATLSSLESPDGLAGSDSQHGARGATARGAAPGQHTIEQVDMSSETYRRRRLREIAARHAQADQAE